MGLQKEKEHLTGQGWFGLFALGFFCFGLGFAGFLFVSVWVWGVFCLFRFFLVWVFLFF